MRLLTQIAALSRKNGLVFLRRNWSTYFTCFILPVLWSLYVAQTKENWYDGSIYGDGQLGPMRTLPNDLKGELLVYVDNTNGTGGDLLRRSLSSANVTNANIKQVATSADIIPECPEGLSRVSPCYAAVVFDHIDAKTQTLNYTLKMDSGRSIIDVKDTGNDHQQTVLLPLQWAIESTFILDATGSRPPEPEVWEYTNLSLDEYRDKSRIDFLKATRSVVAIVMIVEFLFVAYQLPGRMTYERAIGLAEHLDVMGCSTLARVLSWHLCMSGVFLASWILYGVILKVLVYTHTNMGIMIVGCVVAGLATASWSFLVAVPFEKLPTLAAITSMLLCLVCAIVGRLVGSNDAQIAVVLFLPPSFFVILARAAASFEIHHLNTSLTARSPDGDTPLIALFVVAVLTIFIYPALSVWLERRFFGRGPAHRNLLGRKPPQTALPSDVAVRVDHISKAYHSRSNFLFGHRRETTAIADLTFDVPRGEVFCLLGRNGSAKSTTLGAIAGLLDVDSGSVACASDLKLGVAGQKNVLWDELTPLDHVRLWRRIKDPSGPRRGSKEDDLELLRRCDLEKKAKTFARNLSGGQKRKLQLACALAGGSNLILLDEVSSGLDPLSRRAVWNVVAAHRGNATMVLSTHYLDEADYLGDSIAILEAPGRLLASGAPTELKRAFGRGYTLLVDPQSDVLSELRAAVPGVTEQVTKNARVFHTNSANVADAGACVRILEGRGIPYALNSTTLEEVFLDLNAPKVVGGKEFIAESPMSEKKWVTGGTSTLAGSITAEDSLPELRNDTLVLTPGSHRWWLDGVLMVGMMLWKRFLVFRRAWFVPVCAVLIAILACTVPLFFLDGRDASCRLIVNDEARMPLAYSQFLGNWTPPVLFVDAALDSWAKSFNDSRVDSLDAWRNTSKNQRPWQTYGGLASSGDQHLLAFEGKTDDGTFKGLSVLNMYTNSALQRASASGDAFRISPTFQYLPSANFSSLGKGLAYMVFFAVAMAIWPAFAVLYPAAEKATLVRENQYSNGGRPSALWAGHILSEVPGILLVASLVVGICAGAASSNFQGLGLLWLCIVLYGASSILWGYVLTLKARTPVAAFATCTVFNLVIFLIYFSACSTILGSDKSSSANWHMYLATLGSAWISPHVSVVRAIIVSLNLFGLLCDGRGHRTSVALADLELFGAPLIYMAGQACLAFLALVWIDSGRPWLWHRSRSKPVKGIAPAHMTPDVAAEEFRVEDAEDELTVQHLTKVFHKGRRGKRNGAKAQVVAVRDVSFGVEAGELFALIGPNGAGKTTTLACVRGAESPDAGDVRVGGRSIRGSRNRARAALGVCPQANAIDPCLTVAQHLGLYARLKGVPRFAAARDVALLLHASGLMPKANELAKNLSGGNQRKLLLAMALIGDRGVVLIDEFSSGVDAFSQREAWEVLAALTRDRAVVMTTHSMEEVDALATRIGVISTQLLAVGTPRQIKDKFRNYEVQLPARDVEACLYALHSAGFSDAYPSPATTTRITVPNPDVLRLLATLESIQTQGIASRSMSICEASTETAFVEIVTEHQNRGTEDELPRKRIWWKCGMRARR